MPIRDALTIARMEDRERVSVSQLTSKMGLDMTNAAEVRQVGEREGSVRSMPSTAENRVRELQHND